MMKSNILRIGVYLSIVMYALIMDSQLCYGNTSELEDVVYLKNGSIIRGMIIEQVPGESLKIETRNGNVFVYSLDEVKKFTKEPSKNTSINPQGFGKKSGGTAFLLSLVIPGGGQFYNGEGGKGAMMLGASLLGVILISSQGDSQYNYETGYYENSDDGGLVLGTILLFGGALWSLIDAPISSARINREYNLASIYNISDRMYVGFKLERLGSQSTPYFRAVLSL